MIGSKLPSKHGSSRQRFEFLAGHTARKKYIFSYGYLCLNISIKFFFFKPKKGFLFATMTTGDLKNNLRKFHAELKLVSYVNDMDIEGLSIGRPSAFLPILHFVLTEFSIELAQYFYSKEYELLGKNDKNFVSVIYRILRDEFNTKPPLTKEQFFTLGFAERKLQFVTSLIQLCRKKSDVLKPRKKKNILGSNTGKYISHLEYELSTLFTLYYIHTHWK